MATSNLFPPHFQSTVDSTDPQARDYYDLVDGFPEAGPKNRAVVNSLACGVPRGRWKNILQKIKLFLALQLSKARGQIGQTVLIQSYLFKVTQLTDLTQQNLYVTLMQSTRFQSL